MAVLGSSRGAIAWLALLVLAVAGIGLGLVGVTGAVALAQVGPSWPSFQGGPAHLGSAPGLRPGFRTQWRVAPEGDARLSSPAVGLGLAVSVGAGRLVGFDPTRGTVLWTMARARGPLVPPALEPSAGENGIVLYVEGADRRTSALVAIDGSTRERLWRVALGDVSRSAPAVSEGRVFLGARDDTVYAVELDSGRVAWKAKAQGRIDPAVAVADGRVFVVSESPSSGRAALDAYLADTGKLAWSFSPSQLPAGATSPTVAQGSVYVGFGDGTVRAIDAASGEERWHTPVRADFSPLSSPAYDAGRVYVVDRSGGLYAFDAGTGKRAWDFQFEGAGDWAAPIVSGSFVHVGLDDGTLATVDVGTGHLRWQASFGLGPLGPLAAAGDLLLMPSIGTRGGVTALVHDPAVRLVDLDSPTELKLGLALLNYVIGAAAILVVVIGGSRLLARRRDPRLGLDAPPPGWSPRGDASGNGAG
jgi:outer membrane protein assembly factor BamB